MCVNKLTPFSVIVVYFTQTDGSVCDTVGVAAPGGHLRGYHPPGDVPLRPGHLLHCQALAQVSQLTYFNRSSSQQPGGDDVFVCVF